MAKDPGLRPARPRGARRAVLTAVTVVVLAATFAVPAMVSPASATQASGIKITLQGCRNTGSISLPNGSGNFICADSAYTGGNLGSGWNELDLVPFRVLLAPQGQPPASQTYSFIVAADYTKSGVPGYDHIESIKGDTSSWSAGMTGGCTVSVGDEVTNGPSVGGADVSIYRLVTVTQSSTQSCVFNYTERLALGSHAFNGSSLHSVLREEDFSTGGIGSQDVPIPVSGIVAQGLSKTETATQGAGNVWQIDKSVSPTELALGNTCNAANADTGNVTVTVTVTHTVQTTGDIVIDADITATNPASRIIDVTVSDTIYLGGLVGGTVPAGATAATPTVGENPTTFALTSVPADNGTAEFHHIIHVAAGAASTFSDHAQASYTDHADPALTIPGQTDAYAQAAVITNTDSSNGSVTVTDLESIAGDPNISYRVNASGSPASTYSYNDGAMEAYTLGTYTTRPVLWTSGAVTAASVDAAGGSQTFSFSKTVSAAQATSGTATLSDVATVVGDNATVLDTSPTKTVSISTSPTVSMAVSKTTDLRFASSKTFTFHLLEGGVDTGKTTTVTIPAGSQGPVTSSAITGLNPASSYSFHEDALAPYGSQDTSAATFTLVPGQIASCSQTQSVSNTTTTPRARVKKDTVPASSGNWTFTLTGTDGTNEQLTNVQAGGGYVAFTTPLSADGTTYTITETQQTNYDLTGLAGDFDGNAGRVSKNVGTQSCSFTLNLSTDAGATTKYFECAFTNTLRGHVTLTKTVAGQAPTGTQSFAFDLCNGAIDAATTLPTCPSGPDRSVTANATNGGTLDFGYLPPATYTLCEVGVQAGWSTTWLLNGSSVTPQTDATTGNACWTFTLSAGGTAAFAIDNVPPPGGGQRTIGYWRNWSCQAPGKQTDQVSGKLPITLGNYTVTNCGGPGGAVDILSHPSSKYAEHQLAAQLLAAKLNLKAQASSCASVNTAIAHADYLISTYAASWQGSSASTIIGNNSPYRADFLNTASILDRYNNGLIC